MKYSIFTAVAFAAIVWAFASDLNGVIVGVLLWAVFVIVVRREIVAARRAAHRACGR